MILAGGALSVGGAVMMWNGTGDYDNDDFVMIMMMLMVMMILAGGALVSGWSRAVGSLTWLTHPVLLFLTHLLYFRYLGLSSYRFKRHIGQMQPIL